METYKQIKADGKDFEIIFVSSDRNQSGFEEYFAEMPWLALPYSDRTRKDQLSKHFGVQGIPTLVMLDAGGEVISTSARKSIASDPKGKEFPWYPKAVNSVEEPDGINDTPSLVMFMEGEGDAAQEKLSALLDALAEQFKPAKGADWPVRFFKATSKQGRVSPQIRKMVGIGEDFSKPVLALLDIPDQGGYYLLDGDPTDAKAAGDFLRDFAAGKLKDSRKQLARM